MLGITRADRRRENPGLLVGRDLVLIDCLSTAGARGLTVSETVAKLRFVGHPGVHPLRYPKSRVGDVRLATLYDDLNDLMGRGLVHPAGRGPGQGSGRRPEAFALTHLGRQARGLGLEMAERLDHHPWPLPSMDARVSGLLARSSSVPDGEARLVPMTSGFSLSVASGTGVETDDVADWEEGKRLAYWIKLRAGMEPAEHRFAQTGTMSAVVDDVERSVSVRTEGTQFGEVIAMRLEECVHPPGLAGRLACERQDARIALYATEQARKVGAEAAE